MILLGPWLDYVQVRPTKIPKKWRLMPVFCLCSQCDVGFYLLDNVAFCSLVARWFYFIYIFFVCVHVFRFFQLCCCCHVCLLLALSIFSDRREKYGKIVVYSCLIYKSEAPPQRCLKAPRARAQASINPFHHSVREKVSEPSNFHNVERKSRPIKDDPNFAHVFPMFTFTCWKRPLCVCVCA